MGVMCGLRSVWALLAPFAILLSLDRCCSGVPLCPVKHCYAVERTDADEFHMNCLENPDVDADQLTEQLDSLLSSNLRYRQLLSSNLTYGHLTSLSIVNSPLTHVPRSVCQLTTLTRLNLDSNRLTQLDKDCLDNLTELRSLTASNNNITQLQDDLFDRLTKLKYLDLHRNRISSIGLHMFSDSDKLTHLRFISLDSNQLTSLEPWPYLRGFVGTRSSPVYIRIAENMISEFTNRLKFNFTCGPKTSYVNVDISNNRIRHVMDAVNAWNITLPNVFCILRFEQGQPNIKVILAAMSFACDCVDYEILQFTSSNPLDKLFSNTFCNRSEVPWMGTNEITRIPLEEFVCEVKQRCPAGCRCFHRPANATLHVYCSNSNLTALPLELPALPKRYTKYKLDFSNSRHLRRLEHRDYFVNTSILDVKDCSIEEIPLAAWKDIAVMSKVSLDSNSLRSFDSAVTTVTLGGTLSIDANPWECTCENRWMSQWLRSVNDSLVYSDGLLCRSPKRLRGKNILKISDDEFCVDPAVRARSRAVAITLSTVAGALVVLVSVGVVVYRLRVSLYTRWKFHPFDRDECLGEDMDYDVFLACSSEDHDIKAQRIVETVEAGGYRVCYHYRDFSPV